MSALDKGTGAGSRAPPAAVRRAYDSLFSTGLSLAKIKDAALGGRLLDVGAAEVASAAAAVPGRSIAWKLFLVPIDPMRPQPELAPDPAPYIAALRALRRQFTALLLEKMRAPDGSYEEGFVVPGGEQLPARTANAGNLERNNPLSLHDENPWKEWFAAVELRKMIAQDVERTFPDIAYFRTPAVQSQLASILFLYAVLHPDVGYRQGMHELLAPLYYAVDYDVCAEGSADDGGLSELCARAWVAADAWVLFDRVMGGAGRWYEWREAPQRASATAVPGLVHLDGQGGAEPYVAPILQVCNRVQRELLKAVDPALWEHLQAEGIEPQMYGIRWMRLLFTREFSMHDAMVLWDGLFAVDPSLELVLWICVAMLIRIRNQLIPSDYSGQLTYLLRYPTNFPSSSSEPHHTTLLLRQALTLQMSPTPVTGASMVYENQNLLDIPTEVPEPPPPPTRRRGDRPGARRKSASETRPPDLGSSRGSLGRAASGQLNLPELAKGLLDRGEALGINRTFMNAVSEIKKNLPDLAANLGRTPLAHGTSYTSYPLTDERPPEERPPWEPRTRFEMEHDVARLRTVQRTLGTSVSWIVDTLLLGEDGNQPEERLKKIKENKREALEALAYVRDVLLSGETEVDEERLMSEEEYKRRQQEKQERVQAQAAQASGGVRPQLRAKPSFDHAIISPPPVSRPAGPSSVTHTHAPPRPRAVAAHSVPAAPRASSSFNAPRRDAAARLQGSGASPFASATPPVQDKAPAPWNYTRSSFASLGGFSANVPALAPPPAAAAGGPSSPSAQTPPSRVHDPLGVLP